MIRHAIPAAALLVLALAAPALAQAPATAGFTQSIGGGAQWAYPTETGNELNGTPGVRASWRGWFNPHLGVEGDFGWWQKSVSHEYRSPDFVVTGTSDLSVYNLAFNVLGGIPVGRATIVLGGGPGWYFENGNNDALINGERQTYSSSRNHFGLQSLADVEVRASDHVSVFGGMRAEWRNVRESSSGVVYPIAGLRFIF